jgi:hypothetical protein
MSLLAPLQWYWDLSAADASIVDQHSGLTLNKIGTTTTESTGGPDGGPCVSFSAGKYQNTSVAKLAAYETAYTVNAWVKSTASSSFANFILNHRTDPFVFYWQMTMRVASGLSAGKDAFLILNNAGSAIGRSGATQEALDSWQMVTGVRRGSNIEFWRNGVLQESAAISAGTLSTVATVLTIGGSWTNASDASTDHRGQLAMAGVWNDSLSQADITRLYNGGNGRRYADLGGGGIIPILRQHYAAQGAR